MRMKSSTPSLVLVVATSLLASSVGAAQGNAGGYKLSGPQIGTPNTGDVTGASLSPDGSRVVYYADRERDDVFELYSAPIGGGPSAKVSQALDVGWFIVGGNFWIAPDSSRVAYLAQTAGAARLLVSPLQGLPRGADATLLGQPFSFLGMDTPTLTAGGRAVFLGTVQGGPVPIELFSAPLDGGSAVRLSSPISQTQSFAVSADGAWVVYVADEDTTDFELYAVPTDGSRAAVKLNGPLWGASSLEAFRISPASTHVAYVANEVGSQELVNELFSVPIDGSSAAVKLNGPLSSGSVHTDFIIGSDERVYYESVEAGVLAVRSVPIAGGTPMQITPGTAVDHQLAPDAAFVVYRTTATAALNSVPTDGSQVVTQLAAFGPGGLVLAGYHFSPDGARVVFRGRATGAKVGIFSAPLDGSQSAVTLHQSPLANGVEADIEIASDGARVGWITKSAAGVSTLYSAPIDGSAPEVELNDPFPASGTTGTLGFDITPDGSQVVYRANQVVANVTELFRVAIDKTTPVHALSDSLDPVGAGDVTDFELTADARAVLYRSDQAQDGVFALYTTPADGSELPLEIHPAVDRFVIHPDDQRVFFTASGGIYVAPVDASSRASLLFASTSPSDLGITADGSRVVYTESVGKRLLSGPSDGRTGPVQLSTGYNSVSDGTGLLEDFFLSPDSSFVLYVGDRPASSLKDVVVVDAEGGAAPIALTSSIALGAETVGYPRISADSAFVLFRLDQLSGRQELFSAPSDGSSAPVALNPAPPSAAYDVELDWMLHPDGVHVLFRFGTNPKSLYRGRVDGTGLPLLVDDVAHEVANFLLTPDGAQVVFSTSSPNEIRSGSSSGGTSIVLATGTPNLQAVTPDGNHVLYIIAANLEMVPIDGNGPTITVSHSNDQGEFVYGVATTPKRVLYRADQEIGAPIDLYGAPYGHPHVGSPLASSHHAAGTVGIPKVTPDGSLAVFVHDRFIDEAYELWAMPLGPRVRFLSTAIGPASAPERLTLLGSGFTPDCTVAFDGVPAQSVQFVNAVELAVIPPAFPPPASGKKKLPVDVTVSDGVSEHVLEDGYTYLFVLSPPDHTTPDHAFH